MAEAMHDTLDGLAAAKLYKYFAQDNNPYVTRRVPIESIHAKTLYMKSKDAFDKFVQLFQTYKIDIEKYFKFLVYKNGKTEKDIPEVLLSRAWLSKYIDLLRVQSQYSKIYKWFQKSVSNIADECIKLGMMSASEYLQHLVQTKQLAAKVASGQISAYYLCAIQNFSDIYSKLDPLSKAELSTISNRHDKYKSDLIEAFRMHKSCRLAPIKLTDELIWKKANKQ